MNQTHQVIVTCEAHILWKFIRNILSCHMGWGIFGYFLQSIFPRSGAHSGTSVPFFSRYLKPISTYILEWAGGGAVRLYSDWCISPSENSPWTIRLILINHVKMDGIVKRSIYTVRFFIAWDNLRHAYDMTFYLSIVAAFFKAFMRTISMYWCNSPSDKRYYFVMSAVLFIVQYFWVYFAIFCSAMKKKSEKVMAWTFLATEVIFIIVLTLMTVIIMLISRL